MPNVTATDTLKKLETDFNQDNHENFKENYKQYLQQFDEFNKHHSSNPISGGHTIPALNPMLGGENFHLTTTTKNDGEKILERGKAAQEVFGKMGTDTHLEFLKILQSKINKYSDDIKLTITADMGKPIDLTNAEVDSKGKAWFEYAEKNVKKQIEPKYGINSGLKREGVGVAQIIGAFNYPFALTIPGIVGGLATGNSLVVTTPEKAPNWIFPLMQAAKEATGEFVDKHPELNKDEQTALKNGLIQYSVGREPTISTKADLVHFVGSDAAGEKIKKARGDKPTITPTILELGGSNVVAVMNSAVETGNSVDSAKVKKIVEDIYGGIGPATGQRCTKPGILLVQDGASLAVADQLNAKCDEGPKVGSGGIGNSFSSGTKMGPLVDAGAYEKMKKIIELAKSPEYAALGVEVHGNLDANRGNLPLPKNGRYVNPVIIDLRKAAKNPEDSQKVFKLIKEEGEVFGPLMYTVHPVRGISEAIKLTNELDTHNLASAIYTEDKKEKDRFFVETFATSKTHNGPPKDKSPDGLHGHPSEMQIGGDEHFKNYTKLVKIERKPEHLLVGSGASASVYRQ